MDYKISTIVPVYNCEKYLSQCIESLINQTYKKIEIIIIDDGSTDNSLNIIKQYAERDSRIKWFHQENKGGNFALNFGITKATGDLIHFLDSDDYIELNAYEIIANEFINHPEIDSCLFGFKTTDKDNNISSGVNILKEEYLSLYRNSVALIWFYSAQWGKVTKKELIINNKIKFDDTLFGYDVLFHLSIIKYAKKVVMLPNQFIYYRVGNQNSSSGALTRSRNYDIHLQCFNHCVKLYEDLPKNIYYENVCRQFEICINYFKNSLEEYKLNNYFIIRDFINKLSNESIESIISNKKTKQLYYSILDFSYINSVINSKNNQLANNTIKINSLENEINILKNEITTIKSSRCYKFAKKLANIKRKFIK